MAGEVEIQSGPRDVAFAPFDVAVIKRDVQPVESALVMALPDNVAVGRLAAEEFARRGFSHFAYVPQTDMQSTIETWDADRLEGFSQAVDEQGGDVIVYRGAIGEWTQHHGDAAMRELPDWLASLPKPVGIFAPSDIRARHVLISGGVARCACQRKSRSSG